MNEDDFIKERLTELLRDLADGGIELETIPDLLESAASYLRDNPEALLSYPGRPTSH